MINSKELRIGNMVMFMSREIFVHGGTIQDLERDNAVQSQYKPIPLTTEILEKCGFEVSDENKGVWFKRIGYNEWDQDFFLQLSDQSCDIDFCGIYSRDAPESSCQILHHPNYLHQLQNLYYALTQTELEIKL